MLSVLRVRMRLTVHRRVGTPRVRAAGTGRVRVCIGHRHRHGARSASARESDMHMGYGLGACMGSRRGALSGPVAFPKMLPKRRQAWQRAPGPPGAARSRVQVTKLLVPGVRVRSYASQNPQWADGGEVSTARRRRVLTSSTTR
jgi:hypothetical protein